jgi:hypothetical protein
MSDASCTLLMSESMLAREWEASGMPEGRDVSFGRTAEDWDVLTEAGLEFLVERAKLRRTTSYTELNSVLVRRTGLPAFDFELEAGRAAMGELLGRIVTRAATTYPGFDKLMISCLVIYLNGNDAGSGFYAFAHDTGLLRRGDDRTTFWVGQVKGVYDYFAH